MPSFIPMQRELEMSTTQVDGGKHKLELLLQREVEQQQLQNHMRKSMLNSMPKMVPPQVQPLPASSGVLVWAQFLSSKFSAFASSLLSICLLGNLSHGI